MALSGMIQTEFYNPGDGARFAFRIYWSAVQSISKNESEITLIARLAGLRSTSSIVSGHSSSLTQVTIDGKTYSANNNISISGVTEKKLLEVKHTVKHNENGAAAFVLGGSQAIAITFPQGYVGTVTRGNVTQTLDAIPRASEFSALGNFTIGANPTCRVRRKASGFTHTVTVRVGSTTIKTMTGLGDLDSITLSDRVSQLLGAITGSKTGTVSVTVQTYQGSTAIGTAITRTCTATVPSTYGPDAGTLTAVDTIAAVSTAIGMPVQNQSELRLRITGASAQYGAAINKYEIQFQGTWRTGSDQTLPVTSSGTLTIKSRVTDSRGFTAEKSITVAVLAYSPPSISGFSVRRSNSSGALQPLGTYARVEFYATVRSLINSYQRNKLTARLQYRAKGASTWTTAKTLTPSDVTLNHTSYDLSGFGLTTAYQWRVLVSDWFREQTSDTEMGMGTALMVLGKHGVGFGTIPDPAYAVDVVGGMRVDGRVIGDPSVRKPTVYYANDQAELNTALNGAYSRYGSGAEYIFIVNVLVGALSIHGGQWLVRGHTTGDQYEWQTASTYNSAGGNHLKRAKMAGTWTAWTAL